MTAEGPVPPQGGSSAPGRREFIRLAGLAGAAVTFLPVVWRGRAAGVEEAAVDVEPQATDHRTATPLAQWVMVIDLAACDGCGLCTQACQKAHFTEKEWLPVFATELEDGSTRHLPRPCMQCENAPCVAVCPVKATFHDEHGNVLVDHARCIGCRMCMAACPYGARSFNWAEPGAAPGGTEPYRPEYPVTRPVGTVEKCMFCAHRSEEGELPACLVSCPMNAIWFGDRATDLVTNGKETKSFTLLISQRNGFRLKEELGTRPRVWYLPGHGESFSKVPPL